VSGASSSDTEYPCTSTVTFETSLGIKDHPPLFNGIKVERGRFRPGSSVGRKSSWCAVYTVIHWFIERMSTFWLVTSCQLPAPSRTSTTSLRSSSFSHLVHRNRR